MNQSNARPKEQQVAKPSGTAYLIGRLDHMLSRRIRDSIAPMGITAKQYTALSVFRKFGQLSNAQLAERSMVSPQSANEMVKMMEQRGWIARESPSGHGRIIQIGLTQEGLNLLKKCDEAVVVVEAALLAEVQKEDQGPLYVQLKAMVRGLSMLTL